MSDSKEKILSALLDGAQESLDAQQRDQLVSDVLTELDENPDLKASYQRHQVISATLRGEADGLTEGILSGAVHSRIMQAIESSPVQEDLSSDTVVDISSRVPEIDRPSGDVDAERPNVRPVDRFSTAEPGNRRGTRAASNDDATWWRPAAAFAVAASVVAVALFAWNPSDVTPGVSSTGEAQIASTTPANETESTPDPTQVDIIAASSGEYDVFSTPGTTWASVSSMDDGTIQIDSRVNGAGQSYLNMLLVEHGSATAMNGLSTYAKFVSFDASPRR